LEKYKPWLIMAIFEGVFFSFCTIGSYGFN
jgi:hypothetical protein